MSEKIDKIGVFVERLQKIGITVELHGNVPWIYMTKVNGKAVTEKFQADNGFTVAFLSLQRGGEPRFTDISEIFKIIRKYK
jgi:hypothetical protein